jgi:4-hydroxy-3-methylbut-2-enyl diphosphate reductase
MTDTYFRKGFGLSKEIAGDLHRDYHSAVVEEIRSRDYEMVVGDITFRLARAFGFCYGVDRAVDYAYEARTKFPDRRIFLVGEIIHNPHVNTRLREMGVTILLRREDGQFAFQDVTADDVVVLPAFGVTIADFQQLRELGCVLVDTTCGSVLNVWKRVESYARDGFTALVHGKYEHEETRATTSQVTKYPEGSFLVVRDMAEAEVVCDYIERGGDATAFLARFANESSPEFDPEQDLLRVGVANQTTMLANESLAIAERVRESMARRHGEHTVEEHFRSFDTICSATQERQDAIIELIDEPLDAMIVIGGYNSSNTNHLAALCAERVRTFHIADAIGIDPEHHTIRHRQQGQEVEEADWLPSGPLTIGITAGASTPNNKIGEAVVRICTSRGLSLDQAHS